MWLPGTKISTRPIFFERNHSKRVSVENSQGRFQSEISRLLYGFHHHYFFLGREKNKFQVMTQPWPFLSPVVGGHDSPLISVTFSLTTQKGHRSQNCQVDGYETFISFWFRWCFLGSETSFDSMFFLRLPKKQCTKERNDIRSECMTPTQTMQKLQGNDLKTASNLCINLDSFDSLHSKLGPSNDPWKKHQQHLKLNQL